MARAGLAGHVPPPSSPHPHGVFASRHRRLSVCSYVYPGPPCPRPLRGSLVPLTPPRAPCPPCNGPLPLSLPPSRFRSAAWRCSSPTWASPPTRAPPAASSPEPVPAPPNCRLGPPTPQRERTRVGASLRFPTVWEPGAPL
ncbi:basic proline-rich protein-like [Panthera tigris]|uniref:basic proline-rich protein-like n=1 Tax=Panthera tigris TaxID=9694 RepID=UPI0007661D0E|nr:basic proline-rich protein-like [Panthera tigris]XP_015400423.1 basic proline-rich protein-like [Panthera tigris]XP_042854562.1 basic proline-rich protein-like [Panthera tigris]XP_042854563.1 basic proline-rich protein-like [Panthera tigris]XP_042854564.1 basic proline-rich protein-like [Panthera tigris]XP_042854565.1 basic proline-rich protein-like [Panthera tigris]